MNLFDGQIKTAVSSLDKFKHTEYAYDCNNTAKTAEKNHLILTRDAAYELGGGFNPCVGICVVTSDLPIENGTSLYGDEIQNISTDCPFAKIVILKIDDKFADEQAQYNVIKELEFLKFKSFITGFMSRASAMNHREQIRVSKDAVAEGLSFEKVGNTIINEYLKNTAVRAVRVIFCTLPEVNYDTLTVSAEKNYEITAALNHIFDNVNFDCSTCNLKPICDEVEGMRELHMKMTK